MISYKKENRVPAPEKTAPHGIMTELNTVESNLESRSDVNINDAPVAELEEETQQSAPFTAEELNDGYRMSIILGEPLGKRGWRYGLKK